MRQLAISCNAVIDGLWMEGCALPEAFGRGELVQLDAIAHVAAGIRQALLDAPVRRHGEEHAAAAILDKQAPQGVTCIKLMSMIPREGFLDILAEARRRGLPVAGAVGVRVHRRRNSWRCCRRRH